MQLACVQTSPLPQKKIFSEGVTLRTFFSSTAGQGFQNTKWEYTENIGLPAI